MQKLTILSAHNNEPIPAEFVDYPLPQNKPLAELTDRQIQKWKSQRMAHFLLHQIFEQYGLDTRLLGNIQRTASGRPYIDHPEIDFNISHSGEWVAVMVSQSLPKKVVGIDIEHPQKIRPFQELLAYYAPQTEIDELNHPASLPQLSTEADRFYLSWCLREAILKSQGVGIVKLSEVAHQVSERKLSSAYCPQGILTFYWQLPFYLAFFAESPTLTPHIYQWQAGRCEPLPTMENLTYQVN